MNLKHDVPIYGNIKYRGKCPVEALEQITFFNKIRREYPDTWGKIREKAEGMTTGASDIIVGGFYCELKRQDHTLCKVSEAQIEYLEAINNLGYFGCIALGYESAFKAFEKYARSR